MRVRIQAAEEPRPRRGEKRSESEVASRNERETVTHLNTSESSVGDHFGLLEHVPCSVAA